MFSALAIGFLTTKQPGKSQCFYSVWLLVTVCHLKTFPMAIYSYFSGCCHFRCPLGHYPFETVVLMASFRKSFPLTISVCKSHSEEIKCLLETRPFVSRYLILMCPFLIIINSSLSWDLCLMTLCKSESFLYVAISTNFGFCLLPGFTTLRNLF